MTFFTVPIANATKATGKEKAVKKKATWKERTKALLSKELKNEYKRYGELMKRNTAQCNLIRYALKDDYRNLVAYTHAYLDSLSEKSLADREDDEIFSVALLLVARQYSHYSKNQSLANSREPLQLFFSLANLMEQMPIQGDDTKAAWILLLDRFERWIEIRTIDGKSNDIDDVHIELRRKLTSQAGLGSLPRFYNRFLFTDDDQLVIRFRERELFGKNVVYRDEEKEWPYDKDLKLVSGLHEPVSKDEYHGSPYSNISFAKDQYAEKFVEQLQREADRYLFIRNFNRKSSEIPVEGLIKEWNWYQSILKCLTSHVEELRQYPLKDFMSVVDLKICTSLMLSTIMSICAQGEQLIPATTFRYCLANPILNIIGQMFQQKVSKTITKMQNEIFSDYVEYFLNAEVSRQHTVREWWMYCASQMHISPQLKFPCADFGSGIREQLGSFLMSVVLEACKLHVEAGSRGNSICIPVFSHKDVVNEESSLDGDVLCVTKMIKICNAMMEVVSKHQFEWMVFPTDSLPMEVPPRPWLDSGEGGPYYGSPFNVLRAHPDYSTINVNYEMKKRLKSRKQARPVFDALNDLGVTPWKINGPVLDVALRVFEMAQLEADEKFLEKLSIPIHPSRVSIPDYVAKFGNMEVDKLPVNEWREYSKAKYEAMKKRNELNSLWCWLLYRLTMANHFKESVLFFPHSMDFRGRVYPITPYLNHMGDDLNRSLLVFAEGRPLGDDGLRWLKLHCINLTGILKKESNFTRAIYADEMLPKMLESANSPLSGEMWWTKSEEPWQTLSACMEIRNALQTGDPVTFISHLPVYQDGSCNGLQHYAALGRDQEGGMEVNLVPAEKPSDVYSSVAVRVEQKRLEDEKSPDSEAHDLALSLRTIMPDPVSRKVIKQTVMTTVYGVTMNGARRQIERQLKAIGIDSNERMKYATYLADRTFRSLNDAFTSSMKMKDWFRDCAEAIVKLMHTVEWITPLGLPVYQPYLETIMEENKVYRLPKSIKQVNAFPPNFVHSLDSTHMMLTALYCRRLGITFAAVHDCYWTHACEVDQMNRICREQFVQLHSEPLVKQCAEFFRQKYLPNWLRTVMLAEEFQELRKIFTPKVRQGMLDLDAVRKSTYFFY
ncbi:DNA-dependent RNA polymerase [Loa loa]|uniref:DNA-directed RNA polymerase n=1 Tax=Loa loa TaxID=7209 RepID=A0A1S0TQ22_LOALO|nr:DNA-dependent RNA polymerase [Loa loa]EFO18076.2 DNA-dependent RNA polymerase [Loa loa]